MSDFDRRATGDETDPGLVCPVCGRSFDGDHRYCSNCGGNLAVRRDDDEVYDRILRMCGNPCSPPTGAGREQ